MSSHNEYPDKDPLRIFLKICIAGVSVALVGLLGLIAYEEIPRRNSSDDIIATNKTTHKTSRQPNRVLAKPVDRPNVQFEDDKPKNQPKVNLAERPEFKRFKENLFKQPVPDGVREIPHALFDAFAAKDDGPKDREVDKPDGWRVEFDPGKPVGLAQDQSIRIPLPQQVKATDIFWPTHPSPYVAIGKNENVRDVRSVYDIRSGRTFGHVTGVRGWGWHKTLSSDGRLLGLADPRSAGVFLFDVPASRQKKATTLPEGAALFSLHMAGAMPIAASIPEIWTLPVGQRGSKINLPDSYELQSLAFSPGGRYTAIYHNNMENPILKFYEIATGGLVGEAVVPRKGVHSPLCSALMFSPDGKEIAGLFNEESHGEFLLVWRLDDASLVYEYRFEKEMLSQSLDVNPTPIQWFPQRKQWLLYGSVVVDRDAGRIIWRFPKDQEISASRRALNDGEVIHAVKDGEKVRLKNLRLYMPGIPVVPNRNALAGKQAGEKWRNNSLGMVFCWCPAGAFTMGNPNSETDLTPREKQVHVRVSKGFWIGQFEVTQNQWQQVMGNIPWKEDLSLSEFPEGLDYAASCMYWSEAMSFCDNLTTRERRSGRLPEGWKFTLPTEAQWEYACRAGTTSAFSFGNDESRLDAYGWYMDNGLLGGEAYPHRVG